MSDRRGNPALRFWGRVALITVAVGLILYIIVAAWAVLLPFLLGLILAWILLPAVNWLDAGLKPTFPRNGVARLLAIFLVYFAVLAFIVAFGVLFVPALVRQTEDLFTRRQSILQSLSSSFAGLRAWYDTYVPPSVRDFISRQIPSTPEQLLATAERDVLVRIFRTLGTSLAVIGGYLIVPFWLIYLLYDAERFRNTSVSIFPESSHPDIVNVGRILNDVASDYLRGQVFVAFTVGALTGLGLFLLGVNYALVLGVLTAILDLIPTFGPILAAIPILIIAALERPILALWALILIVGVREFEDLFVGPRVVGDTVRIRPALIIILLLVAGYLWGFLGLLLVVPVTAILRDIFRYLYVRTSSPEVTPSEALRLTRRRRGL